MPQHSRQESMASSYVSSNAMANVSNPNVSAHSTSTNKSSSRNPIKIGPWKLGKTLGKGSTGRVLLATNINNGQKAAVKVVSKSLLNSELNNPNQDANNDNDDERDCDSAGLSYGIEREIIIMKLLNHKNVLRLYDVWETDNALYLVLEYVEGGELFDLLVESGPLPESTAIEFFKQIILGASYCHNLGICHRDLKPENLLLDKNFNIKIADFGMAALESNDRLLETSCGSPHYAAPEIVSGLQYHGAESDVWSCGVILFALLTGRLPFDDDNIRELLLKVQKGQYELVEDISSEAADLISKMLTVDPTKRIKTRDIFRHPLIQKYPFSEMELQDYNDLPSPTCATRPVRSRSEIDEQILENLVILWHGRDVESIIHALLGPEANSEKTFYSLLLRYRHDHSSKTSRQSLNKTTSAVTKSTSDMSIGSISTTTNKKSKRSSQNFSASSSRKRISFQKTLTPTKSSTSTKRNSLQEVHDLIQHQQQLKAAATVGALHTPALPTQTLVSAPVSRPKPAPLHFRSSLQAEPLINNSKRTSMMSTKSTNRNSMLFLNDNKTNRNSMILSETPIAFKRNSAHTSPSKKRSSRKMRNSVTSKLLSTYAKLADMDESQSDKLDKKVRRTSADFATLCDMLFNDDISPKKKTARLPNSETMNTMKAILFAEESSGNKRASMGPSKSKRNSLVQAKKRQSTMSYNSTKTASAPITPITPTTTMSSKRASSNPLERISRILNNNDLENVKRRSMSSRISSSRLSMRSISSRPPSVGPPPKPASKLDPRYKVYHDYEKRKSAGSAQLLSSVGEYEVVKPEKYIDETETVLGSESESFKSKDINDEYEDVDADTIVGANGSKSSLNKYEDLCSPTSSTSASSTDKLKRLEQKRNKSGASVVRKSTPTSIADVKVPQVTRRSRNFPDNRLSVLSLYSTKHSSTRLSAYLNDIDLQLKEQNDKKDQNRNTSATGLSKGARMSMLFTEDDVVDMDVTLDSNATQTQDNSTIRRDQISDDDLCFVNKNTPPKQKQSNSVILTGLDHIPTLNYKESKDTLMSADDGDMDDSNFDGAASSGHKLPEIPGSPIKEEQKRKSLQSNFDIYEDEKSQKQQQQQQQQQQRPLQSKPQQNQSNRKSYAVDDIDQVPTPEINSHKLPLQGHRFNNPSSKSTAPASARIPKEEDTHVELAVNKQRKPLGEVDQNKNGADNNNPKRKGSFFRKLSLGKSKPQGAEENGKRKVSLTQAFIALFTGYEEVPTKDIRTILTQADLYEALKSLLISWKQHGITNARFDPFGYKIAATISKKNALGLKACKFGCEIVKFEDGKAAGTSLAKSKIVFSNLKGSGKSFNRLVREISSILEKESILVN